MFDYRFAVCVSLAACFSWEWPSPCQAQTQVLSSAPPNVEYQFQLYYPRWYGWPGPGLSLGGSLPTQGREGYSSFYGRPLPVPLGSGVFVNSYAYASQMPGPFFSYGLSQSGPNPNGIPMVPMRPMPGAGATGGSNSDLPPAPPVEKTEKTDAALKSAPALKATNLQRSREMEAFGNENLRHQQWAQACVNYRNAVEVADENADAHFRLAVASVAQKKYSEAVREFKKALSIDPGIVDSEDSLATILGSGSQTIRTEMTQNVARWTREDVRDQDRLFLLGAVLRLNDDARSQEILEAAYRVTGSGDHLVALLTPRNRLPGIQLVAGRCDGQYPTEPMPISEGAAAISGSQPNSSMPPLPAFERSSETKLPELHRQPMPVPGAH